MSGVLQEVHREIPEAGREFVRRISAARASERRADRVAGIEATHLAEVEVFGTKATKRDVLARMREQDMRFIQLRGSGELTREWTTYGEHRQARIHELTLGLETTP